MTKHLADHRSAPLSAKAQHFWAMSRRGDTDAPHPAIRTLSQRPIDREDTPRLQHYLRIERGEYA